MSQVFCGTPITNHCVFLSSKLLKWLQKCKHFGIWFWNLTANLLYLKISQSMLSDAF